MCAQRPCSFGVTGRLLALVGETQKQAEVTVNRSFPAVILSVDSALDKGEGLWAAEP